MASACCQGKSSPQPGAGGFHNRAHANLTSPNHLCDLQFPEHAQHFSPPSLSSRCSFSLESSNLPVEVTALSFSAASPSDYEDLASGARPLGPQL